MSKVWFVTGSSRGLGLALVEIILRSGDIVVATARKTDSLQHLVDKYGPGRVLAVPLDVTNHDQVLNAVDEAIKTFSRIDIVVNNAGYADFAAIEDMSLDSFRAQLDVNFFGVVYVTKAIVPVMRKQGSGHIIQVSSIGGRVTAPGYSAYQSAKWALGGFSLCLSQEVAPFGIKVTVLEPGGMDTDWSAASSKAVGEISEPYQQTVGAFWDAFSQSKASWSSPADMANLIWKIPMETEPPLRLLAGRATVAHAKMASEALAASDEKWEHLTTSV
jgi:NAD(P)-dependent dehydrogenase (short-subunit alcohol dehydrogenase family)